MENYGIYLVLRVLGDDDTDRIEPLDIADTAHQQIGTRLGIRLSLTERCYPSTGPAL